jgi:serine protease Do
VHVERNSQSVPIQLVVATAPEYSGDHSPERLIWSRLGIRTKPLLPSKLASLASQYNGGLEVTDVRPDGLAARHGIRKGDVLVGMMEWETVSLDDLEFILNTLDASNSDSVPFYVVRNQVTQEGHLSLLRR